MYVQGPARLLEPKRANCGLTTANAALRKLASTESEPAGAHVSHRGAAPVTPVISVQIRPSGTSPPYRCDHVTAVTTAALLLLGGSGGGARNSDTSVFSGVLTETCEHAHMQIHISEIFHNH